MTHFSEDIYEEILKALSKEVHSKFSSLRTNSNCEENAAISNLSANEEHESKVRFVYSKEKDNIPAKIVHSRIHEQRRQNFQKKVSLVIYLL